MIRPFRTSFLFLALAGTAFCRRLQVSDILADEQTLAGRTAISVAVDIASIPGLNVRPDYEKIKTLLNIFASVAAGVGFIAPVFGLIEQVEP
jgi:hypothetical protein